MSERREYVVEGMSCEHCRAAVMGEVGAVPGVRTVEVDLAAGRLSVEGEGIDDALVHEAVDEAGYRVAT